MFKTHLGRITKLEMRTGWGQAVSTRKFFWSIHPELGTVATQDLDNSVAPAVNVNRAHLVLTQ